jgi:hypothetical protein
MHGCGRNGATAKQLRNEVFLHINTAHICRTEKCGIVCSIDVYFLGAVLAFLVCRIWRLSLAFVSLFLLWRSSATESPPVTHPLGCYAATI